VIGVFAARPAIVAPALDTDPRGLTLAEGTTLAENGTNLVLEKKTTVRIVEETDDSYRVLAPGEGKLVTCTVAKESAPKPDTAPPLLPFVFITIACGAISGFHSLVSSGTSSKQLDNEKDALAIGYGGMLTEAALATLVVIAVAAGIGMASPGSAFSGSDAWYSHYTSWKAAAGLGPKVKAFVEGSANMLGAYGIPRQIALGIMGVAVASFAGTTLDSATRIQRYVVSELARGTGLKPLSGKHAATIVAVVTAAALALAPYGGVYGKGGLILWPLFGATNQLIAALALLVATVYLGKRGKPTVFTLVPMLLMLAITGAAMTYKIRDFVMGGGATLHLLVIGIAIVVLQVWMIVEIVVNYRSRTGTPT
jgi:carbon starvation protein